MSVGPREFYAEHAREHLLLFRTLDVRPIQVSGNPRIEISVHCEARKSSATCFSEGDKKRKKRSDVRVDDG
jgi:hypothetical protein